MSEAESPAEAPVGAEGDDVVVEDTPGYKKPAPRALSEVRLRINACMYHYRNTFGQNVLNVYGSICRLSR